MQRFVGCYLLNYFYYRSQKGQFEDDESLCRMLDSEIQKEKDQEKNSRGRDRRRRKIDKK
jgi:hypothetical protein